MSIKFRAWNKKHKKYFVPSAIKFDSGEIDCIHIDADYKHDTVMWAEDIILEQSTGLKDGNGKEIYDGDILKFHWYDDKFLKLPVKFHNGSFRFIRTDGTTGILTSARLLECEIIGNIHEEVKRK